MIKNICKWCGKSFLSVARKDICDSNDCLKKEHLKWLDGSGYKIDFRDIPNKYTTTGNWECAFSFKGVVDFFFSEDKGGWKKDTQPPFQRELVWSEEQKIGWVEHILKGGKSASVFYCNAPSWNGRRQDGKWNDYLQLIDGQQRLSAVKDFVEGKLKVFGKFYYKDIFLRAHSPLRINVNDLQTDKEVLNLYLEMNSGGTNHTKEELEKVQNMIKGL
ncbi:MAG: DUF262 domain-containing protein [Cetobacterium sp.]